MDPSQFADSSISDKGILGEKSGKEEEVKIPTPGASIKPEDL